MPSAAIRRAARCARRSRVSLRLWLRGIASEQLSLDLFRWLGDTRRGERRRRLALALSGEKFLIKIFDFAFRVAQTGFRIDSRLHYAFGYAAWLLFDAFHHLSHIAHPHGQGCLRAGLVTTQRMRIVEADPCHSHQTGAETAEPGVDEVVRRSGFAREVVAPELHCTRPGSH